VRSTIRRRAIALASDDLPAFDPAGLAERAGRLESVRSWPCCTPVSAVSGTGRDRAKYAIRL